MPPVPSCRAPAAGRDTAGLRSSPDPGELPALLHIRTEPDPPGTETTAAQRQSSEAPALLRRINGFMLKT